MVETLSIAHHDHSIPISVARPSGTVRGGVLILASIFGNDEGTLGIAEELAQRQLLAVTPALFFRGDTGPCGFDGDGKERAFARMRSYDRVQGLRDLWGVVRWMRAELDHGERSHITAHGICFGGHLAAHLVHEGAVDALSTVHGGRLESLSAQHPLTGPASLHFGDQDSAIPLSHVEQVRSNWPQAEVIIHRGASHGFAHPGSPAFMPDAYHQSFERLVQLSLPEI